MIKSKRVLFNTSDVENDNRHENNSNEVNSNENNSNESIPQDNALTENILIESDSPQIISKEQLQAINFLIGKNASSTLLDSPIAAILPRISPLQSNSDSCAIPITPLRATSLNKILSHNSPSASSSPRSPKPVFFSTSESFPDEVRTLKIVKSTVSRILSFGLRDLKEGVAQLLLDRLQKLQQICFQKKLHSKEIVTKILLIFSRVARLAHHHNLLSLKKGSFRPHFNPLSRAAIVNSQLSDSNDDIFESMVSECNPEEKSMCRICENFIPSQKIVDHTKECLKAHSSHLQNSHLNTRLSKYLTAIIKTNTESLNTSLNKSQISQANKDILNTLKTIIERLIDLAPYHFMHMILIVISFMKINRVLALPPDNYEKNFQTILTLLNELRKINHSLSQEQTSYYLSIQNTIDNITRIVIEKKKNQAKRQILTFSFSFYVAEKESRASVRSRKQYWGRAPE